MDFLEKHVDEDPAAMPALSYHSARESEEYADRRSARLSSLDQPQPFERSRVRAYGAKLEAIADPQLALSNAAVMASTSPLRSAGSPEGSPDIAMDIADTSTSPFHAPQILHVSHGTPPQTHQAAEGPTLGMLPRSPLGRTHPQALLTPSPPLGLPATAGEGRQLQLSPQPQQASTLALLPRGSEAALGEITALKIEIAQLEGTLAELRGGQVMSTLGRPVKPPRNLVALREAHGRAQGRTDRTKATDPLLSKAGNTLFPMQATFGAAAAPAGKARRLPPTRREAQVLGKLLEDSLPLGVVTAKIQQSMFTPEAADDTPLVDLTTLEHEFRVIDSVLRAASEQVSGSCLERGEVLEKLRQRYGEFFVVLSRLHFRLQEAFLEKCRDLKGTSSQLETSLRTAEDLEEQLEEAQASLQEQSAELEDVQSQFELYRDESKELLVKASSDKRALEATVAHYEGKLQKAEAQRTEALADATGVLEDDINHLSDERDDLMQRVRFLERQLAKLQSDTSMDVAMEHQSTQTLATAETYGRTENEGEQEEEEDEEDVDGIEDGVVEASAVPSSAVATRGKKKGKKKGKKSSKAKRNLGGFSDLITVDKVGRMRSRSWVIKIIAQMYADKMVADAVDDRENNDRQRLCEYAYDWHLNRYGLPNLAEVALLDVIASSRNYAKSNTKIRLFSHFTGLVDSASPFKDSMEHVNFYLYCLGQLAGSQPVTSLFPDTEDTVAWLKPAKVLMSMKTIFRMLGEPDKYKDFMTHKVEPLQNKRTGLIDADVLLLVLLEEWSRRLELNAAHLKALFRAGDSDDDGLVTYDDFLGLVALVDPELPEQQVTKMYREALKACGGEMVDPESFVMVMQKHGLNRWRITWEEAQAGTEGTAVANPTDLNPDDMFEILDSVLATTIPSLEEQLRIVRDKISDESTIMYMEKHYRAFMTKYSSRVDPEGAWLGYRLLVGKIAAVLNMYRTGQLRSPGSPTADLVRSLASNFLKDTGEEAERVADSRGSSHGSRQRTPDGLNTWNRPPTPPTDPDHVAPDRVERSPQVDTLLEQHHEHSAGELVAPGAATEGRAASRGNSSQGGRPGSRGSAGSGSRRAI